MSYIVLGQSGLHYETCFKRKKNHTHTHMHTHIFVFSFKHYLQRKPAGTVGALRCSKPLSKGAVWCGQIIAFRSMCLSSPDRTGLGLHLDLLVLGPREGTSLFPEPKRLCCPDITWQLPERPTSCPGASFHSAYH